MKNKCFKYLFCTLIFTFSFICFDVVSAVTKCEYNKIGLTVTYDEAGTATINQDLFPDKEYPPIIDWFVQDRSGSISTTDNIELQPYELQGFCPETIYTCKYEEYSFNEGIENIVDQDMSTFLHLRKVFLFYSKSELEKKTADLAKVTNDWKWNGGSGKSDAIEEGFDACSGYDFLGIQYLTGAFCSVLNLGKEEAVSVWHSELGYAKRKLCQTATYTGDKPTYNLACPNLTVYLNQYTNALSKYKSCNKNDAGCISNYMNEANSIEDRIKNYCSSLLKSYDYDGGSEQDCLQSCMGISDTIITLKRNNNLLNGTGGECGFSGRLIVWISNIVRWVKYIIPVVVIILGILDFIKAIASESDDEMKKAQKRFIIRLIAAALIFVIPFIIEFILDKMGFAKYIDGCGIIDL